MRLLSRLVTIGLAYWIAASICVCVEVYLLDVWEPKFGREGSAFWGLVSAAIEAVVLGVPVLASLAIGALFARGSTLNPVGAMLAGASIAVMLHVLASVTARVQILPATLPAIGTGLYAFLLVTYLCFKNSTKRKAG
jgi:hypothetical protein